MYGTGTSLLLVLVPLRRLKRGKLTCVLYDPTLAAVKGVHVISPSILRVRGPAWNNQLTV
jgi:hypothetical protein